ncbi:GIP, partial [Symbiodinium microadriaticum]
KSLPNAAAICQQYFSFRRNASESIGNFLVRETLVHEEFVEAIIRLHEEKEGISQDQRDFGLPPASEEWDDDSWSGSWGRWNYDEDYDYPYDEDDADGSPRVDSPGAHGGGAAGAEETTASAAPGSSPSHGDRTPGGRVTTTATGIQTDNTTAVNELSVTDSFIMGVLRGWRLLQAAGLSAEEKRDILGATKNSLDYDTIANALQNLWDDQLLAGHRHRGGGDHFFNLTEQDDYEGFYQDEWWQEGEDWQDGYFADGYEAEDTWWPDDWPGLEHHQAEADLENPTEISEQLQEAQKAEQVAESLALEANRTWSEAHRAAQARGFGAVTVPKGSGKCFNCGGSHYARDCPHARPGASSKGFKGKGAAYTSDMFGGYYIGKGKGKGKNKGKKGMWLDAQAWTRGKGKAKSKGKEPSRSVNAYSADYFMGGLELSEGLDLNSADVQSRGSRPQVGMLDCGATASAAPEAVVQGLITAVLAVDKGARIELDQTARPYFRFGNGKWGRAVCRTTISSQASGQHQQFSLYTLPNPPEYYQSHFDKSTLVPILIGMDYLGAQGVGMMIDFATGLAMKTKEPQPKIFKLDVNHKGHFTLDIVDHLTRGQTCHEGQAHVVVRNQPSALESPVHYNHDFIELATVWFDLAVGERDPHEHALAVAQDRMWVLYRHAQSTSSSAAATAQMCGVSYAPLNSTTTSSRTHGVHLARDANRRPRGRGDHRSLHEGESQAEAAAQVAGSGQKDESGPERPEDECGPVAMLQSTHPSATSIQSMGAMDCVPMLQPEAALHSSQGSSGEHHGHGQRGDGDSHADGVASTTRRDEAHCHDLSPRDQQDHGRDRTSQSRERSEEWPIGRHGLHEPTGGNLDGNIAHEHDLGHGARERRGADSGVRERDQRTVMRPIGVDDKGAPLYIGKKLMAMAAMMTAATASMLVGLHLEGRDGLWEVTCAPHTWMSQAAEEHGLQPRRIDRSSGYDLYKAETWEQLRLLRRRKWPKKLWFSLPYTKWDHWAAANSNTEEKQDRLDTARRKERRLLWYVNQFIKKAIKEDDEVDIYFEWPHPGTGWRQQPMVDLEGFMQEQGVPWLSCRVDGCVYGMKEPTGQRFLKKSWMIKTTDEKFHRVFRAKVCRGQHGHHQRGDEGAATSFYPWKMVQSITRHWRDQLAPERHVRLLQQREDQAALIEEFPAESADVVDVGLLDEEPATELGGDDEELEISAASAITVEAVAREAVLREHYDAATLQSILLELRMALQPSTMSTCRWKPSTSSTTRVLLGGYSHGAFSGICKMTMRFPEVTKYINHYLRRHAPQHSWSSVLVGFNSAAVPHRDHHNLKNSSNLIHGVGDYEDGGLWLEGEPPHVGIPCTRRRLPDGHQVKGYVLPTRGKFVFFDPEQRHATQAWRGLRMTLSAYTTRSRPYMEASTLRQLRELGFALEPSTTTQMTSIMTAATTSAEESGSTVEPTKEELERWQAKVAKFHKAAGHPTNRNLAKIIKDAGHQEWRVRVALEHVCPTCQSLRQGGTSSGQIPPAATHASYRAWAAVGADVGEWVPPGSKQKVKFVLFMDLATKLRVVQPLYKYGFLEMRTETADDVLKAFSERWLGTFPKPDILILDAAKTFAADTVHDFCHNLNVQVSFVAEKEAWAHGALEAGVQDVKMTASAIHLEERDQDPFITLYLSASALNSTEYTAGYSSFQWAFGREYTLNDEDVRTFSLSNYKDEFAKLATARENAEAVATRTRAKRVLTRLNNTTVRQPLRVYKPMDLVKVWRRMWPKEQFVGPRGGLKKSGKPHWIGPGRVVFNEVLPHQEADDERRHIVWVLIGTQLFRCSSHSVRPVTTTEQFVYETSGEEQPSSWKSLADLLPRREFQDLTDQVPREDEVEEPDLPLRPDDTTVVECDTIYTGEDGEFEFSAGFITITSYNIEFTYGFLTITSYNIEFTYHDTGEVTNDIEDGGEVNDYSPPDKRQKLTDWVSELYTAVELENNRMDIFTAFQECNEFLQVTIDLEVPQSNRQRKALERHPVAYLVKKMKDAEVSIAKLPAHERVLFERAKTKEVDSFIKNEAVRRCLDTTEVKKAYESQRIVRARWVLTWKLTPTEDMTEAQQDRLTNENTVYNRDGTRKAKARIVLLGFEHPNLLDPAFKTASPVQSTVGRNLLYSLAAHHQWQLEGLDLATAFLQTQATEADKEIWTSGVKELREALGVGEEGIMRILRNIYGSTTAPRGLWLDLHKTLTALGGQPVPGERCLWIFLSKTEKDGDHPLLRGAMGGHVDDFHRVGDDSGEWQAIKEAINKAYKWGMTKSHNYRHAGTDVATMQDDRGYMKIVVNQDYYAEGIPDLDIEPVRLRSDESLSRKDVEACRTSLGALQWLAIQSQPHICARCNLLLTDLVTRGDMATAREIQEIIMEVRREPFSLTFQKFPSAKHWSDVVVITMGDQAHANRPKGDSTGGLVTLLAGPECLDGRVCSMSLVTWRTWKLKRKAIGSNYAEVQAMLEAEDQNFRTRLLWAALHGAGGNDTQKLLRTDWVENAERIALRVKGILCTDSKGGYDA